MRGGSRILLAAGLLVGALVPGVGSANHCGAVTASPSSLWPPNHKLRTVTLTAENPDCDVDITTVTQDEALDAPGSGHTTGFDAANCEDDPAGNENSAKVDLRAERAGPQDGRYYTIMWTANDDHQAGSTTVSVPHDKGKNHSPVDGVAGIPSGVAC